MPTISIIVPIYNVESYLHRCINSVINQTFSDWELLLVNDGSPDNSDSICKTYAMQDTRIKYFLKPNGGVSSARNLGLKYALGDWIMFLDSDDWLFEDCLMTCFEEVMANNLDVVQFGCTMIYDDGRSIEKHKKTTAVLNPYEYIEQGDFNVCVCGGLYKSSIIVDSDIEFPVNLRLAEDQIFVLNVFKKSTRLRYIDLPMYYYYQHDNSAVHNKRSNDMITACTELIRFATCWSAAKVFTDSMCLVLILDIISNRDVDSKVLIDLYRMGDFCNISKKLPLSCIIFNKIAKISPKFAIELLSLYFAIR